MSDYNLSSIVPHSALSLHAGLSLQKGDDCYGFASLIPTKPLPNQPLPEQVKYHTYWRADLAPLSERQILLLDSILATQSADHSTLILWTNNAPKLQSSPSLARILAHPRFSLRQIDIPALAQDSPLEGNDTLLSLATDSKAWLDGDLVRLLLLYKFGGIWVDMDFLLLRDFRSLTESEWVIQWDCYDKPYAPLNGAVMHFYKQSSFVCEMLYAMTVEPLPKRGTTDWGSLLYLKVWRRLVANGKKPFAILPWCFMDGRSCRLDNRLPDPFEKDSKLHETRSINLQKRLDAIVRFANISFYFLTNCDSSLQFTFTINGPKTFQKMGG